jgi:N-methylhydantoinase A/oxoprolinase/acetone carboxylase beta subunit
MYRVATDIGGTFTDLACHPGRTVGTARATTPRGVRRASWMLSRPADRSEFISFVHGTTVVVNDHREEGAKAALLCGGF